MEKTKIILIRHGQSLGNARREYLGHTDYDLTERGYAQAEDAARYWKDEKIDAIYSSDLKRAFNTAAANEKYHGVKAIGDPELREVFLGDWEGVSVDILETVHYDTFILGWRDNFGLFTVPGGESIAHAAERFYNAVVRIAKAHPNQTVMIGAHAAVIRSFWCKAKRLAPEEWAKQPWPLNASSSVCYFDGEDFELGEFSVDSYLTEVTIGDKIVKKN